MAHPGLVHVDPSSAVPPYEQVRTQVVALVDSGGLRPGDRLPPVRTLAADLGLASGTVARAYRELESAGVVVTRGRNGTVVAATGDATERLAQQATADYLAALRRLGLGAEDGVRLLGTVGDGSP
ncbi:GntR family transcriptional regulator [Aquipuribacter hungaricus]|uniref:GntR family transcriptional regulator n=1 Tax=Aquipuribacter hungaricus TaxID=545624 RepID=A0ABV7WH11_9MICO